VKVAAVGGGKYTTKKIGGGSEFGQTDASGRY